MNNFQLKIKKKYVSQQFPGPSAYNKSTMMNMTHIRACHLENNSSFEFRLFVECSQLTFHCKISNNRYQILENIIMSFRPFSSISSVNTHISYTVYTTHIYLVVENM